MKADSNSNNTNALVAQLDRVTGYEPVGRGFESLQARQAKKTSQNVMSFLLSQEGQSLGISCHWHDIFILPPLQARQKKHCELQCFFFFILPLKLPSFSHFSTAHNPQLFCKSKTTPASLTTDKNLIQGHPLWCPFDSYTKILSQFRLLNLSIIR